MPSKPGVHGLTSKPTTQVDMESPWFLYWCQQLKVAPVYHRKLWEFTFCLQALFEQRLLKKGVSGFGFGCGEEPLASYFASKEMNIVISDLSPEASRGKGWTETGQHTSSLEKSWKEELVSKKTFEQRVRHRFIDMNKLPCFDEKFDFCWSICALEHLGSIQKGLDFIENSLESLKPGGAAVHTTEYNYLSEHETIDNNPSTVLFLRKHFEAVIKRLTEKGHKVLGPSFDTGGGVLDKYIDIPPYGTDYPYEEKSRPPHLKLEVSDFPCTCFGLIVIKG